MHANLLCVPASGASAKYTIKAAWAETSQNSSDNTGVLHRPRRQQPCLKAVSDFSILFRWLICLFLCQVRIVLISQAFGVFQNLRLLVGFSFFLASLIHLFLHLDLSPVSIPFV